ncbi:MAG: hypothetical protein KA201_31375 [Kofleriaceae bacterium]|nr:hypothetical protein [Kofleriaceae bacterium]
MLNNWRRHREDHAGLGQRRAPLDRYASGVAFAGWAEREGVPFAWPTDFEPMPTAAPQTWLMQGAGSAAARHPACGSARDR